MTLHKILSTIILISWILTFHSQKSISLHKSTTMTNKKIDPCDTDTLDPDHRLMTWEKWVKIRNAQTKELGQLTERPPTDLAMNLLERVREDKERKTTLEDAKLSPKPTTCRGFLWEDPVRLHQKCKCSCQPTYEITKTTCEKGHPPVIEHIGVPIQIQRQEKGLAGLPKRKSCKGLEANYEKYRGDRETELKDRIEKIDPHRPCIAEIIVEGFNHIRLAQKNVKRPFVPNIEISEPSFPAEDVLDGLYALRINNTVLIKEVPGQTLPDHLLQLITDPWHEECNSWTYYYNVPVKKMGRAKLFLMNLGTVAIRYCWQKLKKPIPFISDDIYAQHYFFNKNEDVISPGQCKEIYITFLSTHPGIYTEYWELSTVNVHFFNTLTDKLTINLHGEAIEQMEIIADKIHHIREKISSKVVHNIARYIINYMIKIATTPDTLVPGVIPYNQMFLEHDLFVAKNPVLFYHQTEVEKMKFAYQLMTNGEEWDLTIVSWRAAMMKLKFEDRMFNYGELQSSFRYMLKPWHEGYDLAHLKERAVMTVLQRLATRFDEEYDTVLQAYFSKETLSRMKSTPQSSLSDMSLDEHVLATVRNIFFLRMREQVSESLSLVAGVVSSIDLFRWLDINFCKETDLLYV